MTPTITNEQRQAMINERRWALNAINDYRHYIGHLGQPYNRQYLKRACIALSNVARIEREGLINWYCYGHPIPVTWLSVLQNQTGYRLAFERPNKPVYAIDGSELIKCEECGRWETIEQTTTITDDGIEHHYCASRCVIRAGWHYCDHCEEWTRYGQLDYHGDFICDDCAIDYVSCYSCGDLVHDDDVRAFDDEWYCPSCYEEQTADLINSYGYNDPISKHGDACDGPYMGVELEVDNGHCEPAELAADLVNHCDTSLFWLTHDGSLNNGVEIASQPMTLAYHSASGFWSNITDRCIQHGYRSHDAGTCGLHIHIDRDYFINQGVSDEHAGYYLTLLSQRFERELTRFSRRRNNGWCEYFSGTDWTDNDCLNYLSLDCKAADCCANYDHSIAVNMEHSYTFELRIFRGTLKLSTLIASLALTDGLARYVATHNEADCFTVSWHGLCQWILDHCPVTDARANLRDYLSDKGLYSADVQTV